MVNKLDKIDFDVYLPTKDKNLQRPLVWNIDQKRELIYSMLIKRYIPPIKYISLINEDKKDTIQIIDGKQRLSTMLQFINNEFSIFINNVEYCYNELPKDFQFEISNYFIKGQAMYQSYGKNNKPIPISDETKIKWFKLINFSGTPQEQEHINSLN